MFGHEGHPVAKVGFIADLDRNDLAVHVGIGQLHRPGVGDPAGQAQFDALHPLLLIGLNQIAGGRIGLHRVALLDPE